LTEYSDLLEVEMEETEMTVAVMIETAVRGHLSVSLPLLSFPTIPLIYPCLYVYFPYLCTISRDHTQRMTTFVFKV
jgi:hypothetical protein